MVHLILGNEKKHKKGKVINSDEIEVPESFYIGNKHPKANSANRGLPSLLNKANEEVRLNLEIIKQSLTLTAPWVVGQPRHKKLSFIIHWWGSPGTC